MSGSSEEMEANVEPGGSEGRRNEAAVAGGHKQQRQSIPTQLHKNQVWVSGRQISQLL